MTTLSAKVMPIPTDTLTVIIHSSMAKNLGIGRGERVKIQGTKSASIALANISSTLVAMDQIAIDSTLAQEIGVTEGQNVTVSYSQPPISSQSIRALLAGKSLDKEMYYAIIEDLVSRRLTDVELTSFVIAQLFRKLPMEEIEYLARAMADAGDKIDFERTVYDKHSIGGVPGNKVSLIVVPIIAAAGLLIPKTSSRSVTSPSGTADTMEVLAPVELEPAEFKKAAMRAGGALVWGGKLGISPADDVLIGKVEHPLSIDPISQLLASVMSKKLAVGVNYLVVDLPVGRGTKLPSEEAALELANDFMEIGRRLGIVVTCGMTYGSQPVGHSVGPALEAREALDALSGGGPVSLREKSTALAGLLLESSGQAPRGGGKDLATKVLESGKALQKMREIIEAQGGNPSIRPEDIPIGTQVAPISSPADGYIVEVNNSSINAIAKAAGAPVDKGAGVLLHAKVGYNIKKGSLIMEIYAEHSSKLADAISLSQKLKPITVEGMLLRRMPEVA